MARRAVLLALALVAVLVLLIPGCGGDSGGTNEPADPVCDLDVESLAFGEVTVSASSDLTFKITNAGGGTLAGTVSESCPEFAIVGTASYSLVAEDTATITVRFSPASAGAKTCTLDVGGSQCADLPCTGTGVDATPVCQVSPASLDFSTIYIGNYWDKTFKITNAGGGTLSGSVSESCDDYSIVSGGGGYSLAAGESVVVTVRFTPTAVGTRTCGIATGASCQEVACTGVGDNEPACDLSLTALDFGTVNIGDSKDTTFTLTNVGGGLLVGEVYTNSEVFSVVGAFEFALGGGQAATFTIRFTPVADGPAGCTIEMDSEFCGSIACTGTGQTAPVCEVEPGALGFGVVYTGNHQDKAFTITNVGGGVLSGSLSESSDDFSIVSGGDDFSLSAGEFVVVTVRFAPASEGDKICTVETGGICSDVLCTGVGAVEPVCDVSVSSLDFGTVMLGSHADTTFTMTNAGGWWLAGGVFTNSPDFSIIGDFEYSLAAGESATFAVRFAPSLAGLDTCTIFLNSDYCEDIACTGVGAAGPVCEVDPDTLDFGFLMLGGSADLTLTIRNIVGGTVSGAVSSPSAEFTIVGAAAYSLEQGDSATFTVRFAPASLGTRSCTIDTGSGICVDVAARGAGAPDASFFVHASSGSNANPGTVRAPFRTITHAVAMVGPNQSICVLPGRYDAALGEVFPIYLEHDQYLIGDVLNKGVGPESTIVFGSGDVPGTMPDGYKAALVLAQNCLVSGLNIDDAYEYHRFGIYFDAVAVTISDNTFGSAAATLYGGVVPFGDQSSAIERNEFQTNSYGVYCNNGSGGMRVKDNVFRYMAIPIDVLGPSNNATIEGNTIIGSGQCGLQVQEGSPLIKDNVFDHPGGYSTYGAIIVGAALVNPKVRGNTFTCALGVNVEFGDPDLGTAAEPGGNDFSGVTGTVVRNGGTASVSAIGNTWPGAAPVCGYDIVITGSGSVVWGEGPGEACP